MPFIPPHSVCRNEREWDNICPPDVPGRLLHTRCGGEHCAAQGFVLGALRMLSVLLGHPAWPQTLRLLWFRAPSAAIPPKRERDVLFLQGQISLLRGLESHLGDVVERFFPPSPIGLLVAEHWYHGECWLSVWPSWIVICGSLAKSRFPTVPHCQTASQGRLGLRNAFDFPAQFHYLSTTCSECHILWSLLKKDRENCRW